MEARFTILLALAVAVAAFAVEAVEQNIATQPASAKAESPFPEFALPPEPYTGFYASLSKCEEKVSPKCNDELSEGIFGKLISDKCCGELVNSGRRCFDLELKGVLLVPTSDEDKQKIINYMNAIWSMCSTAGSGMISPAAAPDFKN